MTTTETGLNDTRHVVQALGEFLKIFLSFFVYKLM